MSKEEGCLRGFMIKTREREKEEMVSAGNEERGEEIKCSRWESSYTVVVVTLEV